MSTLALLLLACASSPGTDSGGTGADGSDGDATDSGSPGFDYGALTLDPFESNVVDGFLCPDALDPEGAVDKQFIDCAIEGENDRSPAPQDTLRFMAWNIERGQRLDDQLAGFADGRVPTPDVLLLSESDRFCARSGDRNVTQVLAQALDMNWAYAVEFVELPRGGGDETCEHGNAVLSRFPLANVQQLRHEANLSWYEDEGEPRLGGRIAVAADVVVGEKIVHVVTVHFESTVSAFDIQVAQAVETAEHAAVQPFGVVVGGDTNAPFYTFDLSNGQHNDETIAAFTDRGFEDTHLSLDPDDRITHENGLVLDLLLARDVHHHDPDLCEEDGCGGLSDHKAVWVDAELY
ncbi:MAG: hypothetical protein H6742_00615 [Alphaproteobacteria bacterium]|nr:hypothetical protein [Alphaproteobacteria bacterium]